MDQILTAALTLAGVTLAFAGLAYAIWRSRHPRAATATPGPAREYRLPKLSRRAEAGFDEVEISPSRLARIRRQVSPEMADERGDDAVCDIAPPRDTESPAAIEAALETIVADVEEEAHRIEHDEAEPVALRLLPQIPLRDAISTDSWLGGRPRLAAGMEWPKIDGQPADFLAQIDCAALPLDLWDGLGPREGALAFFLHRRRPEVRVLHLRDTGVPVAPSFALNDAEGWFGPHGDLGQGDLAPFAIRAFPEWPVDLVAVRAGGADPREAADALAAGGEFADRGYDIADPAFHPFDWGSMTAMAALLEMRLGRLEQGAVANGGDASDPCAAINRDACERAREIIAIVHDSAARDAFSPGDATAVMAALHAIRWARAVRTIDPETGAERIETITLPLTTHHPDADLWVEDYRTILFDRAKHAWCADPGNLSAPARAFYEPRWRAMAMREMAAMGGEPLRPLPDFDEGRDLVLLELPSSGLMSRRFGDGDDLVVTIGRADLAIGDFSKARAQLSSSALHLPE